MEGVHNNTFSSIGIFIIQKLERLIIVLLDHFGQLNAGTSLFAMMIAALHLIASSFLEVLIFNLN